MIGGKAKIGLPVKFQFQLNDRRMVLSGVVRGATFDDKKNRSILHIQAGALSLKTKNAIRAYVYNIFGEQPEPTAAKADAAKPAAVKTGAPKFEADDALGPIG
jgi:hypothetical protein